MQQTLRHLTIVTLMTWAICFAYVAAVVAHLSWLQAPTHKVIPALVWSVGSLAGAFWVGFRSSEKLSLQVAAVIEFVLLMLGVALLVIGPVPHAWWAI